jgi:hypothetical protein
MYDCEGLRKLGLDPSSLYPFVTPRPPAILPVGDTVIQELPLTPASGIRRFFDCILGKTLAPPGTVSSTVSTPADATKTDETVQVGTEEEEDLKDALSPIYDQLEIQPAWWILELLPLRLRYQRGDSSWVSYIGYVFLISSFKTLNDLIPLDPTWEPPDLFLHNTTMGSKCTGQ